MLVDRGDGWHTARLEVDRNDMGDVMADFADPCETLGFGHGGPGYSNYETVEFLNGRRSLLGEGYPRVRNKSPQELSTGLSTNWGQLTWM